jgi:hypothetical protein
LLDDEPEPLWLPRDEDEPEEDRLDEPRLDDRLPPPPPPPLRLLRPLELLELRELLRLSSPRREDRLPPPPLREPLRLLLPRRLEDEERDDLLRLLEPLRELPSMTNLLALGRPATTHMRRAWDACRPRLPSFVLDVLSATRLLRASAGACRPAPLPAAVAALSAG